MACKKDHYCDATCQKKAWKNHKISCKSTEEVGSILVRAYNAENKEEIIRWKSRFDDVVAMKTQSDHVQCGVLHIVLRAYQSMLPLIVVMPMSNSNRPELEVHITHRKIAAVYLRQSEFMCKALCFRDQGEAICHAADNILLGGNIEGARKLFNMARKIAEAHGFYIVECLSCQGLGNCFKSDGNREEALLFLQNALVSAPFCEHSCDRLEKELTECVASSLYYSQRYSEAEELMPRLRLLTRNSSVEHDSLDIMEVSGYLLRIRLYEKREDFSSVAMELRTLGILLHEHITDVLEHAVDYLELLDVLLELKVFRCGFRPSDPIFKIWEIYEQVGGGVVATHFSSGASNVNECK
jgi:tetratricopeptide (TPR) repeat protein